MASQACCPGHPCTLPSGALYGFPSPTMDPRIPGNWGIQEAPSSGSRHCPPAFHKVTGRVGRGPSPESWVGILALPPVSLVALKRLPRTSPPYVCFLPTAQSGALSCWEDEGRSRSYPSSSCLEGLQPGSRGPQASGCCSLGLTGVPCILWPDWMLPVLPACMELWAEVEPTLPAGWKDINVPSWCD